MNIKKFRQLTFFILFNLLLTTAFYAAESGLDPTFEVSELSYTAEGKTVAVQTDGKIVLAGKFNVVNGVGKIGIVRLNADGSLDESFNRNGSGLGEITTGFTPYVTVIKIQADGKILVGGRFQSYNGAAQANLTRLNPDGTRDVSFQYAETQPGEPSNIEVQTDGKILVGSFTTLKRFNADGSADTTFSGYQSVSGYLNFALLPTGKIAVSGIFGEGFYFLRRLNANGTFEMSYSLPAGIVNSFRATADGKLLVGGSNGLFRYNADGTQDGNFTTGGSIVTKVEVTADNKILASNLAGQNIVRLLADGTIDPSFNAAQNLRGVNSFVLLSNGKIILTGTSPALPPPAVPRSIVRLEANGALDNTFSAIAAFKSASVRNVQRIERQPDGRILVLGDFVAADGQTRRGIVRLTTDGSRDAAFTPFTADQVIAFALQSDGKIVVAGNSVAGSAVVLLARINADGAADNSFSSPFNGNSGRIYDVAVQSDGKILLTGDWTTNNAVRRNLARLNANGAEDSTFAVGSFAVGFERIFLLPNDQFLIGGSVSLARYNSDGTRDANFAGYAAGTRDIALQPDGKLIVGGIFSRYIVRLNSNGTIDTSFNPIFSYEVYRVELQRDGKILVGGAFSTVNGENRNRLVRLQRDGTIDPTFNPQVPGFLTVGDIKVQPDGKILFGGDEINIYNTTRYGLARLLNTVVIPTFDYDGDGKADVSVFRPSNGVWYLNQSQNGFAAAAFGLANDKIVPADYDGDGRTDIAVYRGGIWYLNSSQLGFASISFGLSDDLPAPADYDGDGKADLAVFRPSNGTWYLLQSQTNFAAVPFGQSGDKPVAADFDGDGKADIAVFRPSNGTWYINRSRDHFTFYQFGLGGDLPVAADYDGDGRADVAVYRSGNWYRWQSAAGYDGTAFGIAGDLPAAADYDGDGRADLAVFRNGVWYLNRTTAGFGSLAFGSTNDLPTPNSFVR